MFLFKIARRNLFRNTRRSVITMVTVVVGVMGFILSSGLVRGVEDSFVRMEIETEFAHLRIMGENYLKKEEDFPLDIRVKKPEAIRAAIQKKWPKAIAAPRIVFSVDVSNGYDMLKVRGIAIDAKAGEAAFKFSKYGTKKGRLLSDKNVMYMGADLAKTFGKKPGDTLTLKARDKDGSINAVDFEILDTIYMNNSLVDKFSVYMSLAAGRRFLSMPKEVTDIVVRLPSRKLSGAVSAFVKTNFAKTQDVMKGKKKPTILAQTWQERTAMIIELNKVRRKMMNFIVFVILIIAAAGIANTMLMSGFERKGEIGMMQAMGMRGKEIIKLFAIEAGVLGFIASVIGAIMGSGFTYYLQVYGLSIGSKMDSMGGDATSMGMMNVMYFVLSPTSIVVGIIVGVIVSMLSSLWPAWRITRLDPKDTLAGS